MIFAAPRGKFKLFLANSCITLTARNDALAVSYVTVLSSNAANASVVSLRQSIVCYEVSCLSFVY